MPLHHLIYESQATRPLPEAELTGLLNRARCYNEAHAISGLLLYAPEGSFVQVLEGDEPAVQALYGRIARDPRHHSLLLLADGSLRHRRFAGWRMGFQPAPAKVLTELTGHFSTADASFLLPLLPFLPPLLVDKLLDYVRYATPHSALETTAR